MLKTKIRTSSILPILFLSSIFPTILAQQTTIHPLTTPQTYPPFTPNPNDPRPTQIKILKKTPPPPPSPPTPNQGPSLGGSPKDSPHSKKAYPSRSDVYDSWWFILLMTFIGSVIGFIIGFWVKGIIKRRQKRNRILTRMKTSLFDTIDSVKTGSSKASKNTWDETLRVSQFNVERGEARGIFGIGTKVNNNLSYSL